MEAKSNFYKNVIFPSHEWRYNKAARETQCSYFDCCLLVIRIKHYKLQGNLASGIAITKLTPEARILCYDVNRTLIMTKAPGLGYLGTYNIAMFNNAYYLLDISIFPVSASFMLASF